MHINIVVAMTADRVIGRDGDLPWHLSADLKRFRTITLGHPIIMGRRTHESIGRPLPGRENIVVSRRPGFTAAGCTAVADFDAALAAAGHAAEVMVVGGASLYAEALPRAARLFLTEVDADIDGDTFFPPLDRNEWIERSRETHPADAGNDYPYSFVVLERAR